MKLKSKKRTVYNDAKKLYSKLLSIYYDDYDNVTDEEKERMGEKYNSKNLLLKGQRFIELKKEQKSKSQPQETIAEKVKLRRRAYHKDLFDSSFPYTDDDSEEFTYIPDMPQLEGNEEEVKERKRLKMLTPKKLLPRLSILLAQIKAWNTSCKLKNESKYYIF